jgi:uncharacterized protein (TIGR00299 family) protein
MKTLYLDCGMGAAGDMLTAALLGLDPHPEELAAQLNAFGIPGVTYRLEKKETCGIAGLAVHVLVNGSEEKTSDVHDHGQEHAHSESGSPEHSHDHEHSHSHHAHHALSDVQHIIHHLNLPEAVKEDALAVYHLLAQAESRAHQKPVTEIHFHEVGNLDAIADITAVCWLMHHFSPDEVVASPVHVGAGHVHCAHGILPVPAPATAYLLENIPIYGGTIQGELCTPTGAALLKYFVSRFAAMPVMAVTTIGYGVGQKEFPMANCLRAMLGERENAAPALWELTCQVDDMTGEAVAFALEQLRAAGALDAFVTPIYMKKSRPAFQLTVLCRSEQKEPLIRTFFQHTTTLGLREYPFRRYELERSSETRMVNGVPVRIKKAEGFGVHREKAEYDDLAVLAQKANISLEEARHLLK